MSIVLRSAGSPLTNAQIDGNFSDLDGRVTALGSSKQATLVSSGGGQNLKTVNGTSLLGSGDITITGGGSIINDLTTGGSGVALSAQQGVVLKGLTDGLTTSLGTKQATLVGSGGGQNLKTINSTSLLGTGDISITGGGAIINDLTTGGTTAALSAQQGVALKALHDANVTAIAAKPDLQVGVLATSTTLAPNATAVINAIATAVSNLLNGAPGALDTLKELADAINDDASYAATITTALSGKQPLNSDLTALAGLTSAADQLPYATGAHAWALAPFTAFARSLVSGANAAAVRGTLGALASTAPSSTGLQTSDGASITTVNAMGALVIDVTKGENTKTIGADSTFTFSGTPATPNTWFGLIVTNSDASNPHVATIPASFPEGSKLSVTSVVVPAGSSIYLTWRFDGVNYQVFGSGIQPAVVTNSFSANYLTTAADANTAKLHPAADTTARNFVVDSNANVPYDIGTAITVDNEFGAGIITLTVAGTDVLEKVGTVGSTGSFALAPGGQATYLKIKSTKWRLSGIGLTP